MGDYIDNVEIGVHLIVDEKSAQQAQTTARRKIEEVSKPGSGAGGKSVKGPGDVIADSMEKGAQSTTQSSRKINEALGRTRTIADRVSRAFRRMIGPRTLGRLGSLGRVIAGLASRVLPLLPAFGGLTTAIGSAIAALGPIAPVVVGVTAVLGGLAAVIWGLKKAWDYFTLSAENKAALEGIAEADRQMRELRKNHIQKADDAIGREGAARSRNTDLLLSEIERDSGRTELGAGRFGRNFSRIAEAERRNADERAAAARRRRMAALEGESGQMVAGSGAGQLQEQLDLERNSLKIAQAKLQLLQDQRASLAAQVDKTRDLIAQQRRIAEQAIAIQERIDSRRASTSERLGRLSAGSRQRAIELNEKAARGEASQQEIQILEQLVGRTEQTGKFYEKLAKESGVTNEQLDNFTEELGKQQQGILDAAERIKDLKGADTLKELIATLKKEDDEAVAVLRDFDAQVATATSELIETIQSIRLEIVRLQNELDEQRDAQNASGT